LKINGNHRKLLKINGNFKRFKEISKDFNSKSIDFSWGRSRWAPAKAGGLHLPTDFLLISYVFSFKIKNLGRTGQPTGEDGRRDGASKIEERQQRRAECSAEGVEMGSIN